MSQFQQKSITALVNSYGLCFEGTVGDTIVATWIQEYESDWIVKAIVEAVFRGRYKVRSVDDILKQWQRLGKPLYHFEPDFERERLEKFSVMPLLLEISMSPSLTDSVDSSNEERPTTAFLAPLNNEDLDPEELAPFHHHSHTGILQNNLLAASSTFDLEEQLIEDPSDITYLESSTVAVVLDLETATVDVSVSEAASPKRTRLLDKLKTAIGEESIPAEKLQYSKSELLFINGQSTELSS